MHIFAIKKTFSAAIRATLKRITSNTVLIYSAIGDFFSVVAMMGLFFWLPKYLEHQFRVDKSTSNLYTGKYKYGKYK